VALCLKMDKRSFYTRLNSYLRWQLDRLAGLPGYWMNFWFGTLWSDIWLSRQNQRTNGLLPAGKQFAIYVIFPRYGLQRSHIDSLKYLVHKGFSPIVISNLRLTLSDRNRLVPLCWKLIERPNFGYDFGAYRQGILTVYDYQTSPEVVVLLNDSVWFPIPPHVDWLAQAEALNVDLAAAASNNGFEGFTADKSRILPWHYDYDAPRLHYCSFALRFGPRVLRNPEFLRFWKRLKLTSNKMLTIQRGEIGLSRWVISQGYSHAATLDLARFDEQLARLDVGQLRDIAANLVIPEDPELRREQQALTMQPCEAIDRSTLLRFILWATAETGAAYALAYWSLGGAGYGFLKKSPMWLSQSTAEITEALIKRFGDDSMLEEAQQLRHVALKKPPESKDPSVNK